MAILRLTMKLEQLFEVHNGVPASSIEVSNEPDVGYIPYIRPARTQIRTIAGWVDRKSISCENIYGRETIFVSTNGEGSHSYTYVSDFEFVPNSDVAVLLPRRTMSIFEKIYYAHCITLNRYRFSYGRKPKGNRLKTIDLPEFPPDWVHTSRTETVRDIRLMCANISPPEINTSEWGLFQLQDLFDITKGQRLTRTDMLPGNTPYIGASETSNGVTTKIGQKPIHEGGTISVSYNGSVAEAFFQPDPFWATDDVNVLYPINFKLTAAVALFICTILRREKYRFNYGRKWHMERMKTSVIKLPVTGTGEPDWLFMESYIKSLRYSSSI